MPKCAPTRSDHLRSAVAQEAARLMAEHGIQDYLVAKRKAAERCGVVLNGTATEYSDIQLHVFSDTPEAAPGKHQ